MLVILSCGTGKVAGTCRSLTYGGLSWSVGSSGDLSKDFGRIKSHCEDLCLIKADYYNIFIG